MLARWRARETTHLTLGRHVCFSRVTKLETAEEREVPTFSSGSHKFALSRLMIQIADEVFAEVAFTCAETFHLGGVTPTQKYGRLSSP
ncbi:hypothetical protein BaRGS_00029353 [Batillaria attramentaria]|uniref:Uncharacterized protein n=1 Tax=Batillaria attramentaria TaxID=370345 RepID=A0ABD0JWK6_9CAEN